MNEWRSVREAFIFDILDTFLSLYEDDPEDKFYKQLEAAASYEDVVKAAESIVISGLRVPKDLMAQARMSDADFKTMLTSLIPQTDLLLHKEGQLFLQRKINEGLTGPEVDPIHAAVIFDLLEKPEDRMRFFGRLHYMITQPIGV